MANYCQEYCQPLAIHPRQDHFLQPSIEEVAESEVVFEKRLAFVKPLPRLDPNGTNWLSDHWKWIVGGVVLAGALVAGCVLAGCLPDATIVAGGGGGAAVAAAASEGGDPISSAAQDFFADAEAVGGAAEVDTAK